MSNPFQQVIDESASVDHSINDDDYYIVHPDKKHIVSKVYTKVPYGQRANAVLKPYIDSADKRHGPGHKAIKGMHLKREVGYTRLSETTEYADVISRSVLGSYSTNVDEANYHTRKTFLDTGEHKMSPLDKREMNRRYNKIARELEKERKAKEAAQKKVVEGSVDEKTLTPAELKKREEVADALERDKPGMDKSKKMAIATAVAKRVAESEQIDGVAKKAAEPALAEADKHSFIGRIQRHQELKKKVDQTWKDAVDAEKRGDKKGADRAFNKHVRYANLERPGTWTSIKPKKGVEQVTELSKSTLASYTKKAADSATQNGYQAGIETERYASEPVSKRPDSYGKARKKAINRLKGIDKAIARLTKEDLDEMSQDEFDALIEDFEQLDELSKDTLKSYVKKSGKDVAKLGKEVEKADSKYKDLSAKIDLARERRRIAAQRGKGSGRIQSSAETSLSGKREEVSRNKYKALAKIVKRQAGLEKAVDRLTKEDVEQASESMVAREVGGRKFVSAEAAIRLAREIAAKRKEGEKATHKDLIAAKKKLVGEETIREASVPTK